MLDGCPSPCPAHPHPPPSLPQTPHIDGMGTLHIDGIGTPHTDKLGTVHTNGSAKECLPGT
eukprot:88316-Chlamydomonas_euryale.AAC.1